MSSGSSSSASSSGGIGFVGLLTVVFIVLKLIHKISWPWWLVVSPMWIAGGITILILAILVGAAMLTTRKPKRKQASGR